MSLLPSILRLRPCQGATQMSRVFTAKAIPSMQLQSRRPLMSIAQQVRRPALGTTTRKLSEHIRGMKVRSSVKKLCDGCKVRPNSIPLNVQGILLLTARPSECEKERLRLHHMFEESETQTKAGLMMVDETNKFTSKQEA